MSKEICIFFYFGFALSHPCFISPVLLVDQTGEVGQGWAVRWQALSCGTTNIVDVGCGCDSRW